MKGPISLVLLLLCLTAFPVVAAQSTSQAEDFRLKDIYGKDFALSDFRGKVVLLEFFASWCSPCKPEMAELKVIRTTYPREQLTMISVSFDPSMDTDDVLRSLAANVSADWILARDTVGASDKYGVSIAPTIFLIDRSGVIRYSHTGLTRSKIVTPEISQLLSETPQPTTLKATGYIDLTPAFLFIGLTVLVAGLALLLRKQRNRKRQRPRRQRAVSATKDKKTVDEDTKIW